MKAIVGFTGDRRFKNEALVGRVVRGVLASDRSVGVGCAVGLDEAVVRQAVRAGGASQLLIFSIFGPSGAGDWKQSATRAVLTARNLGARVAWRAGREQAASFGGKIGARLAARSQAMVYTIKQAQTAGPGSAVIGFPIVPCSPTLEPGEEWLPGSSSGTWATLALAAGLRVMVIVFLPQGVKPPVHWGGQWVPASSVRGSVWAQGWRWRPPEVAKFSM